MSTSKTTLISVTSIEGRLLKYFEMKYSRGLLDYIVYLQSPSATCSCFVGLNRVSGATTYILLRCRSVNYHGMLNRRCLYNYFEIKSFPPSRRFRFVNNVTTIIDILYSGQICTYRNSKVLSTLLLALKRFRFHLNT